MAGVETNSNRDFWQFIAGTTVLRPKDLVGQEIKLNKTKLAKGLSYYKKQTQPSGEGLSLKGTQLDFIKKLSTFLALDEKQSYSLFCSYLLHEYRGSQKNLQSIFSDDRQSQSLTLNIRDYYYSERIYLLRCLKQILSYSQNHNHPFREEYEEFFDSANNDNELINNNEKQVLVWVRQNLKEQSELLQLILLYYKDFELSPERLATLAVQFKKQAFGFQQAYKHLLDGSMEALLAGISYYQMLILVEGMDIEFLYRCSENDNIEEHHVVKDVKNFKKLDSAMCNLGDTLAHGPLAMMWAVVRQNTMEPLDSVVMATKKLCNTAVELKFSHYLDLMLRSPPFNGKTALATVGKSVISGLLGVIINTFQLDSLVDTSAFYDVATKVVTEPLIAEDFWDRGDQEGLGLLLQAAVARFPLDFHPLLTLSTSLAKAGPSSCKKIVTLLHRLPSYLEFLDENSSRDVKQTQQEMVWKLINDKRPYGPDVFTIPSGTFGELHPIEDKTPLIRWDGKFNAWDLFHGEIQHLLTQVMRGVDSVSADTVEKVIAIARLTSAVLQEDMTLADQMHAMIETFYLILQRFSVTTCPPLELLSSCLEVIGQLTMSKHQTSWHHLKQTGLLPFITENLDNLQEAASGSGLHAGNYGLILAGYECTSGSYLVTEALLDIIIGLLEPMMKTNRGYELMACTLFVLREIFPVFRKWRYTVLSQRERIGQKCLQIFHKVLDVSREADTMDKLLPAGGQHQVSLRQVTVYILLYTEAGRTLLDIIGTGSDVIQQAFVQQGSAEEGVGVELIHMVRLAFSVLNRLLLLRPSDQPTSPVENALSSQPANHSHRHVLATIAQYIYHRHDPRLPTLATLLLKRLAMISPMSILACLGNDAPAVRDMYLARLQAYAEDIRLKVVILEFLGVIVDTQPGLIEVFLNVVPADGKKDLSIGQISCLQSTLDLISEKKQGGHHCPPSLLNAALEFVHALWYGRRETAMAVLREKASFWNCVVACLKRDLPVKCDAQNQSVLSYEIKARAYAFRILALEILRVPAEKLDKNFKTSMTTLVSQKRTVIWSKYVRQVVEQEGEVALLQEELVMENAVLRLLTAWKHLMVVLASQQNDILNLSADEKIQIMKNLLDGIQAQFQTGSNILQIELASISSAFYFILLKYWKTHVKSWSETLGQLASILNLTCANSETLIPSVQIGMLGALTTAVQYIRTENVQGLSSDIMASLFPVACAVLQQSTYQLPIPKMKESDREEASISQTDVKLKLQIVCTCLVEELIVAIDSPLLWLPVFQEHAILQTLLSSVELWIGTRKGLHYVQAVLLLFMTLSKSPEAAEALRVSGLTQHVCLAFMSLQRPEDFTENLGIPGASGRSSSSSSKFCTNQTWAGVYRCAIQLYTSMLSTLRYSFLQDALNFVGVHQDRMLMCLEQVKITLSSSAMLEAENTCAFLVELSHYKREWRLQLRDVLSNLMLSISQLAQATVATLIRPRLLDHILERHSNKEPTKSTSSQDVLVRQVSRTLQNQVSTDSIDQPSERLLYAQCRLMTITAHCLTILRSFSPDLCEIVLDQSMDISEYEPLLQVNFSTPALDTDSYPSFGTVLSCANLCLKQLTKLNPGPQSPLKWPKVSVESGLSRPLLLFTLESCLQLAMSQAMRYLKEPGYQGREKQLLKRELGAELNQFLNSLLRYLRRGGPPSPSSSQQPSPQTSTTHLNRSTSQTTFSMSQEQAFFKLVDNFVKQVLR